MKKASLLILATLVAKAGFAQDVKESDVSTAMKGYREYRLENTVPSYGLARVKAAIKRIKPTTVKDADMENFASTAWSGMSTAEKFTYCMLHGEVSSQNCDVMPWIVDEEHKVFANPPPFNGAEQNWSDRQNAFLKNHRHEVVAMLRSTIREKGRVGVNLKNAIVTIHADELIPDLVRVYDRDHKDQDLLSVFAVLMKDGKDKSFLASITYRKLYGPDANYQSFIVANPENQKLMMDRAMAFYRSRVR